MVSDVFLIGDVLVPDTDTLREMTDARASQEKRYTSWIFGIEAVEGMSC
jgi:hypothetical protein